jgi:hypothetical protein
MSDAKDEIIKTKSIKDVIINQVDFEIINIETYLSNHSKETPSLINVNINELYKDRSKLINEHTEFQQFYHIKLLNQEATTLQLEYSFDYGDFTTHPKIILNPNSKIPYKLFKPQELFILLVKEINKIKAKETLLINIFDEIMIKNLKAFTKYLYSGKFTKRVKIPLFEGVEPTITRESKLILHFENKSTENQVIEVEKGELLVEYIKPLFGSDGFNAYGKIVSAEIANNIGNFSHSIDTKSIEIIEEKERIVYKSKLQGYVHYTKETLHVDNRVQLSKISRNQDLLAAQEENNIEVTIAQDDTTKDSVGEGVELTSEVIHIKGHVGANSIIEATNLKIDGATHQDSSQFAKYAQINRHKGKLRCHEAEITLLEGGEVHATRVDIDTALGGIIYAQDVTVRQVKSNLKIYASNSITIKHVSGEDNLFKINYKEIPILNSKINLIDDDIEELKFELQEATRHNISALPSIKEKIQNFKEEKNSIINSSKTAIINIQSKFHGLNRVVFIIDDEHELSFKTDAITYDTFHLEVNESTITLLPVNISISL